MPENITLNIPWATGVYVSNGYVLDVDLNGYIVSFDSKSQSQTRTILNFEGDQNEILSGSAYVKIDQVLVKKAIFASAMDGNRLYVLCSDGLRVYNVSTFGHPRLMAFWRILIRPRMCCPRCRFPARRPWSDTRAGLTSSACWIFLTL